MWCAFFFAVGIVLIILGLETLVVGRVAIASEGKVPALLAKILSEENRPVAAPGLFTRQASANVAPPQQFTNYYGGAPSTAGYGQSRFSDQFGNDQFFGANPGLNGTARQNSQFSLAGFGQANPSNSVATSQLTNGSRIFRTQDWMPWSLVAAGAIIVLYTNSLTRRDFGSDD